MSAQFMQFLLTGLTVGAIYALVALGFSIIFNASHVINFAQGEFVMIGGMVHGLAGRGGIALRCWPFRWRSRQRRWSVWCWRNLQSNRRAMPR